MNDWHCTIPGDPVAKGRPRAFSTPAGIRTRTPEKTRTWEAFAAHWLGLHWKEDPLRCPVKVEIHAVFPRPQAKVWKTKPMPRYPHAIRPDGDNIAKAVLDALEKAGVLFNDCQAWSVTINKFVANGDEQPHVLVRVQWGQP